MFRHSEDKEIPETNHPSTTWRSALQMAGWGNHPPPLRPRVGHDWLGQDGQPRGGLVLGQLPIVFGDVDGRIARFQRHGVGAFQKADPAADERVAEPVRQARDAGRAGPPWPLPTRAVIPGSGGVRTAGCVFRIRRGGSWARRGRGGGAVRGRLSRGGAGNRRGMPESLRCLRH